MCPDSSSVNEKIYNPFILYYKFMEIFKYQYILKWKMSFNLMANSLHYCYNYD